MGCQLTHQPVQVAVVGCGAVADQYLQTLTGIPALDLVACADLDPARAEAAAARYGIPKILDVPALTPAAGIDLVVNLTPPQAHYPVAARLLASGVAVYNEKPVALERDHADRLLALAASSARIGGAPDTFLAAPAQHARRLLDTGAIGQPVAAAAALLTPGPAAWHPNPEGFYQPGAGPLLDMGPYYLATLVHLLGPVGKVIALQATPTPTRTIHCGPRQGRRFAVTVATHTIAALELTSGLLVALTASFETQATRTPHLEIYGTEGTLVLPDPNFFDGPLQLKRPNDDTWTQIPVPPQPLAGRGLGVLDTAHALILGTPHRCSGLLGRHVLDVLLSLNQAAVQGTTITVTSHVDQPTPLTPPTATSCPDTCPWCAKPAT